MNDIAKPATAVEQKYLQFLTGLTNSSGHRCSVDIQQDVKGHNGKLHNRYILKQDDQSIVVDFRVFTINELPKNFQNAAIRSPRSRALIGTLKMLGTKDLIAAALVFLNSQISETFASGSWMYYAIQHQAENSHYFFYTEKDTEQKVVVQVNI